MTVVPAEQQNSEGVLTWRLMLGSVQSSLTVRSPQQSRALIRGDREPMPGPSATIRIRGDIDRRALMLATRSVFMQDASLRTVHRKVSGDSYGSTLAHEVHPATAEDNLAQSGVASLYGLDGEHQLVIHPPSCSVDAVGLLRIAKLISARYGSDEYGPSLGPTGLTVAHHFQSLITSPDTFEGSRFWRGVSPADCQTPRLTEALALTPSPPTRSRTTSIEISGVDHRELAATAKSLGTTVKGVLLSAWRLLLSRLAPAETGYIGVFHEGPADHFRDCIGMLGRYLPFPIAADEGDARGLVIATESWLRDADEWGDFFSLPDAAGGFTAGFRHLTSPEFSRTDDMSWAVEHIFAPLEALAVELQILESARDVRLWLYFDNGRIDQALVDCMGIWISRIVNTIPTMTSGDMRQIAERSLAADLRKSHVYGRMRPLAKSTIVSLFTIQANANPASIAVRDDRTALTYRQLLLDVDWLAHRLLANGVQPGCAVAICMERRTPLMTAILAVLQVGAHFVPLDANHPPARHSTILSDSSPVLVVVDSPTHPGFEGVPAITVDDIDENREGCGAADCAVEARTKGISSLDIAYVLYTSGSTGRPKGVEVSHGALANYLMWAAETYELSKGTGSLAHSSLAVDMTVTSLFAPLVAGNTVTMLASDEFEDLARAVGSATELSFLKLTPSGLSLLGQMVAEDRLSKAIRHLVLGGERLNSHHLATIRQSPTLIVTNEYGPTETTVGSCTATFHANVTQPLNVPIGEPIWNTDIQIVNSLGEICPPGIVGEIVIGGAGVARGYHNRPEETELRFVRAPDTDISFEPSIAERQGARKAYRTGDLGRRRFDGGFDYLGRSDHQMKHHGYRIEPQEIEAILAGDPRVAAVAVIDKRLLSSQQTILAAFVVAKVGTDEGLPESLKDLAAGHLPPYARPDHIQIIDRLPLAPSGKLDRTALQDLPLDAPRPAHAGSVDRKQGIIATIWAKVLHQPCPGGDDNFFMSGGDSILGLHMAAEARRHGLVLSLRDVLNHRTLSAIAEASTYRVANDNEPSSPYIGPVALNANQRGILERDGLHNNWSLSWSFWSADRIDASVLLRAYHAVLLRHPALRCRITGAQAWQATAVEVTSAVKPYIIDMTSHAPEDRSDHRQAALLTCASELDLHTGQTTSLCVFDYGDGEATEMVWVVHHLVCDVVSLQILSRELLDSCEENHRVQPDDYPKLSQAVQTDPSVRFPPVRGSGHRRIRGHISGLAVAEAIRSSASTHPRAPQVALAAALLSAIPTSMPGWPTRVCLERHGRDDVAFPDLDMSGVVGWLTSFQPLALYGEKASDAILKTLHSQIFDPQLQHVLAEALPPISLNYLGALPPSRTASDGDTVNLLTARAIFPVEVVCWIDAMGFQVACNTAPEHVTEEHAQRLTSAFCAAVPHYLDGLNQSTQYSLDSAARPLPAADFERIMKANDVQ